MTGEIMMKPKIEWMKYLSLMCEWEEEIVSTWTAVCCLFTICFCSNKLPLLSSLSFPRANSSFNSFRAKSFLPSCPSHWFFFHWFFSHCISSLLLFSVVVTTRVKHQTNVFYYSLGMDTIWYMAISGKESLILRWLKARKGWTFDGKERLNQGVRWHRKNTFRTERTLSWRHHNDLLPEI